MVWLWYGCGLSPVFEGSEYYGATPLPSCVLCPAYPVAATGCTWTGCTIVAVACRGNSARCIVLSYYYPELSYGSCAVSLMLDSDRQRHTVTRAAAAHTIAGRLATGEGAVQAARSSAPGQPRTPWAQPVPAFRSSSRLVKLSGSLLLNNTILGTGAISSQNALCFLKVRGFVLIVYRQWSL